MDCGYKKGEEMLDQYQNTLMNVCNWTMGKASVRTKLGRMESLKWLVSTHWIMSMQKWLMLLMQVFKYRYSNLSVDIKSRRLCHFVQTLCRQLLQPATWGREHLYLSSACCLKDENNFFNHFKSLLIVFIVKPNFPTQIKGIWFLLTIISTKFVTIYFEALKCIIVGLNWKVCMIIYVGLNWKVCMIIYVGLNYMPTKCLIKCLWR